MVPTGKALARMPGPVPRSVPPPLYKFYSVGTRAGLRLSVWARSPDEARSKVHGSVAAWIGLEPLNDNGRAEP